jgi:hypothetical protein
MELQPATFQGRAERIDDLDIPRIGSVIGVGEDEVHALMEVEAGSSGFDSQDRPKMLFEPHVFYRNLSGENRELAEAKGLAYRGWRPGNYPRDSYPRLIDAMEIDPEAALKAASWGRGQILGENYAICGYPTVFDMVQAFMDDEATHIAAMIEFIVANNIDDDLRAHRWEAVARVYNGPGYAKHNYHGRLAAAYARWSRIKDTPWDVRSGEVSLPILRFGHYGFVVDHLQESLEAKGYPVGALDGDFGPATRSAVLEFQADNGLPTTGEVSADTWSLLLSSATKNPVAEGRKNSTVADLRQKGSRTVAKTDSAQATGGVVLGGGVIGTLISIFETTDLEGAVETGEDALNLFERAVDILAPATVIFQESWHIILVVVGAYVVWNSWAIKKLRLEDHRSGKHRGR